LSGGQALSLTYAASIGGNQGIAPGIALLLEVAKEPRSRATASIPALEEGGFVRAQETPPAVTPAFAPRKGGGLEIALHGVRTHFYIACNSGDRPALTA
jgi:hypothetical protein